MSNELLVLIVLLVTFAAGVFVLKLPSGVALALSALLGAIAGGEGIPIRHLVEGSIAFLDPILIVFTAMVFMKVVNATGALASINFAIITRMHKYPTLLIILMVFFIMFPGMLTGISSTCILTTGALVAPALLAMGMPIPAVGALLAMSAVFGMIAPPINLPVMIIGGGVDMPYIGFEKPLILATFPAAIITALYFRIRYLRKFDIAQVLAKLPPTVLPKYGYKMFIPILFVIGMMIATRVLAKYIPDIGIPLIFLIGALLGFGTGEKFKLDKMIKEALHDSLPILAILVGVGMFVQIMTLTGVRGFIATSLLDLPQGLLYPAIAIIMPAFGSAFTASSVFGVPLVYAFLGTNEIVVTSALTLIAGVGDLMPPPLLLPIFAGQIVGEKNNFTILKYCAVPIILTLTIGVLMIMYAREIGAFL
ncbi:MAG: TRAP transporter large permease [Ignavibacteriales bacterium]|nr:TRAP transporter large permease [Ignavibacteriales bacterium]